MLPEVGAVSAALIGALAYGTGDFLGGRASEKMTTFAAVAIAQTVAVGYMLHVFFNSGAALPPPELLQMSLIAGLAYSAGLLMLYHGLAQGRIGVVAPLCGLFSILVPLAGDFHLDREIGEWCLIGVGVCAIAVVLLASSGRLGDSGRGLGFSVWFGIASGIGYGVADLVIGMMPPEASGGALVAARSVAAFTAVVLFLGSVIVVRARSVPDVSYAAVRSPTPGYSRTGLPANFTLPWILLAAAAGVFDMIGQIGYVVSATQGSMGVAASLVALFPAVSVLLAVIVLKERVTRIQVLGFAASLLGVTLVSI